MLVAVSALAGCITAPKPPQEPNMSRLVPVNKTLPSELPDSFFGREERGAVTMGIFNKGASPAAVTRDTIDHYRQKRRGLEVDILDEILLSRKPPLPRSQHP
ncbi:hypothetical protein [Dickeya parazeae]|nr:hypothetical protein [Dickeya parazeae]